MEQEDRKEINRILQERFTKGNKQGKYLANILRKKKTLNYIEKIKNDKGEIKNKTTDIAQAFSQYYSSLYAIKKQESNQQVEKRRKKIQI